MSDTNGKISSVEGIYVGTGEKRTPLYPGSTLKTGMLNEIAR